MTDTLSLTVARQAATFHANNADLRPETRAYFAAVAVGQAEPDDNFLPFWDALAGIAKRGGTPQHRGKLADALAVLRSVVAEHGTVPDGSRHYVVAITATITVDRDGRVTVTPDYGNAVDDLRAQLDELGEDDDDAATMHADVETITDHLMSEA